MFHGVMAVLIATLVQSLLLAMYFTKLDYYNVFVVLMSILVPICLAWLMEDTSSKT